MARLFVAMRSGSLLSALALLAGGASCLDAKEEDTRLQVQASCPSCPAAGIRTLEMHVGTAVTPVTLDGNGSLSVRLTEDEHSRLWIGLPGNGPMSVRSESSSSNQRGYELVPWDWGPNPLQDTVIEGIVRDSAPLPLQLQAQANTNGMGLGISLSLDTVLLVGSDARFRLHFPSVFFRTPAPVPGTASAASGIAPYASVLLKSRYRGMAFSSLGPDTFVLRPQWPPRTSPYWATSSGCFHDTLADASVRTTCLTPPARSETPWTFHRTVIRDGLRTREDSGTWNDTTRWAHFVSTGPGLPRTPDSLRFDPRFVLRSENNAWWMPHDPPLEQAVHRWEVSGPDWKYFFPVSSR